jgi:DHA1 family tetracycline resistance protein-like MFS transporter
VQELRQEIEQDTNHASQSDSAPKPKGSVIMLAIAVFLNIAGFTLILPVIPFLVGQYVPPVEVGLYVGLIV